MVEATQTSYYCCTKDKQCEYHKGYDRATKDLLWDEKNHTKDMRDLGWTFGFYLITILVLFTYIIMAFYS